MQNTKPQRVRTTWQTLNGQSEQLTFNGVTNTFDLSAFEYRNIVKNPDWKVLVSRKLDAGNPYSTAGFSSTKLFQFSGEDYNVVLKRRGRTIQTGGPGAWTPSIATDNVLKDQALARLKHKLQDRVGNVKAMTPLVELRELRQLVKAMTSFTRGFIGSWGYITARHRGKRVTREAANAWLTYQFGISPMMSDTAAIAQSIADYLISDYGSFRATGTASKSDFLGHINSGIVATNDSNLRINTTFERTLSYRYVAGLDLSILSSNNYGVLDHLGFAFNELPALGWELIPFSWVIDYFTTVGAYLDDTFVLPPGSTKYVCLCTRRTCKAVIQASLLTLSDNVAIPRQHCSPGYFEWYEFQREILTAIPHRSLRFKTLDEIGLGALNKLLNLAAVGSSRFTR